MLFDEVSSLYLSKEVLKPSLNQMAPRFESLPPEIRNMIYGHLLPAARLHKKRRQAYWSGQSQLKYALRTANTAILRTNHNINREASAVVYRDILLVLINWNTNSNAYFTFIKTQGKIVFNYVLPGAPLPPCVIRVQQQCHQKKGINARGSTIIAATDFATICRLVFKPVLIDCLHPSEARTSYSVTSLPKMGYSVDRLRELIWLPLLALREGCLAELGENTYRKPRPVDSTGVFERTAAGLNWDSESNDQENNDRKDGNGGASNGGHSSKMAVNFEEDDAEEDGEGDSGEDESDEDDGGHGNQKNSDKDEDGDKENSNEDEDGNEENSDEDGSFDDGNCKSDDEEETSDETTSNKDSSKNGGGTTSKSASSTPCHDGMRGHCGSNRDVGERVEKTDAEDD